MKLGECILQEYLKDIIGIPFKRARVFKAFVCLFGFLIMPRCMTLFCILQNLNSKKMFAIY